MVEGAIRHGTTMSVEGNYVDSHGQSEIGHGGLPGCHMACVLTVSPGARNQSVERTKPAFTTQISSGRKRTDDRKTLQSVLFVLC